MQDPSISTSSPSLNPTPPSSLPTRSTFPSPSTLEVHGWLDPRLDLEGLRVVSGTGEDLGTATGIERDKWGAPKWVAFRESADAPPRRVRLSFVHGIQQGEIRLKGPRQGFHITRVGPDLTRA